MTIDEVEEVVNIDWMMLRGPELLADLAADILSVCPRLRKLDIVVGWWKERTEQVVRWNENSVIVKELCCMFKKEEWVLQIP
jgi:hypothetical protein